MFDGIPVLLCAWQKGKPVASEAVIAITKDIAGRRIGIILNPPFETTEIVIGFSMAAKAGVETPFFRAVNRSTVAIGGGFLLLGVEAKEYLNLEQESDLSSLMLLALKLVPPSPTSPSQVDSLAQLESLIDQLTD